MGEISYFTPQNEAPFPWVPMIPGSLTGRHGTITFKSTTLPGIQPLSPSHEILAYSPLVALFR